MFAGCKVPHSRERSNKPVRSREAHAADDLTGEVPRKIARATPGVEISGGGGGGELSRIV